ncbi:MAG TPA: hypothetical protein VK059_08350 [Nocardioidaceae bacterium]|nr:hypothetical protein [Nocardioidaceae bacterium]
MEESYYESAKCPGCGTHHEIGHDRSVIRNIEKFKRPDLECEDCLLIEQARQDWHSSQGHSEDRCDCDNFVWLITSREPLDDEEE